MEIEQKLRMVDCYQHAHKSKKNKNSPDAKTKLVRTDRKPNEGNDSVAALPTGTEA
jgi:hypothetical protein